MFNRTQFEKNGLTYCPNQNDYGTQNPRNSQQRCARTSLKWPVIARLISRLTIPQRNNW